MRKAKRIRLLEQAITQVPGFAEINRKLERKVKLNSLSRSTYYNYARSIAKVCLHFTICIDFACSRATSATLSSTLGAAHRSGR